MLEIWDMYMDAIMNINMYNRACILVYLLNAKLRM